MSDLVLWLDALRMSDLARVGGKNASLGEMIGNLARLGVSVPGGFATTAEAFQRLSREQRARDKRIRERLATLDVEDVDALTAAGKEIRGWIVDNALPADLDKAIRDAYAKLCQDAGADNIAVAVRSSATAEDLPDASFAGQQETFLNVTGIDDVLHKVKEVFASLYNDRAIAYRVHHGFKHEDVFLSAGVQLMVRSDIGASGVLFTLDTESGFREVGVRHRQLRPRRNGRAGRGESRRVLRLQADVEGRQARDPAPPARRQAAAHGVFVESRRARAGSRTRRPPIARSSASATPTCRSSPSSRSSSKQHYQRPMDIEWAKDGATGKLYIVQARPGNREVTRRARRRSSASS